MSDSWDPMDCSMLDSSVHGILQARVLEWVAISSSKCLTYTLVKGNDYLPCPRGHFGFPVSTYLIPCAFMNVKMRPACSKIQLLSTLAFLSTSNLIFTGLLCLPLLAHGRLGAVRDGGDGSEERESPVQLLSSQGGRARGEEGGCHDVRERTVSLAELSFT